MQEELASNKELLNMAFEHAPVGLAILSLEDKWLSVNQTICDILGYSQDELVGKPITDFLDLTSGKQSISMFVPSFKESMIYHLTFIHKRGQLKTLETIYKPLVDNNQQAIGYVLTIDKIREEKKIIEGQEAPHFPREVLDSLVINNVDAIWVMSNDEKIIEVNQAFEDLFGWKREEVLGKQLPIIPEKFKDYFKKEHKKVMEGFPFSNLRTVRKCKDGSLVHVSASLSPIFDTNRNVIGMTGICRNITSIIRAEEEAEAKTRQLESFITHNVDPIVIFDQCGIVTKVNQAFEETFKWTNEEIVSLHLNDLPLIPESLRDEVSLLEESVQKGRYIIAKETERIDKEGRIIKVSMTVSPIYNADETLNGWSVNLRDITMWKKSQEMLQNSEKLSVAGQLAAGIAHEIRNPMTAIKGFIQLIDQFGTNQDYMDIISSEINRIEDILSELLLLAKPQATKYMRRDINHLLSQTIILLETQAIMKDVVIVSEINDGPLFIKCDESQMKQVFINMIKNAIEAMPKGGTLYIKSIATENYSISIIFKDTGIGMSKDLIKKLGEPFYTTKEKGTGLGFMVSKKIIENHAGHISIDSQPGVGTSIQITFPMSLMSITATKIN